MEKIDLDRYIYKLIPDYMYIDYAEREYWTHHMTDPNASVYDPYPQSGKLWYNIINIMYDISAVSNNTYKSVDYGRCLLVSPVELIFEPHEDEIIHELKKYGDRYVYACFSSEDSMFRGADNDLVRIKFKGNPEQIIEMVSRNSSGIYEGDIPYVVELRF